MILMKQTKEEIIFESWLKDTPVKIGDKLVETDLDLVCVIL